MVNPIGGAITKLFAQEITLTRIKRILSTVAIPLLLNLPQQLRLIQTTKSPKFKPLLETNKIFFYKHLSVYISKKINARRRIDLINLHYSFVNQHLADDFISRIVEKSIEIWKIEVLEGTFTIELAYPISINRVYQYDNEGEISLRIKFNDEVVHTGGFTISKCKNKMTSDPFENSIIVGRIQGAKNNPELIRCATKALHDISPANVALCAYKGIADCIQTEFILGTSNELRVVEKDEVFFDYNKHWIDAGAVLNNDGLYLLPVNQQDKPIELITQKHRSRTIKKRNFKKGIRDGVCAGFRQMCMVKN